VVLLAATSPQRLQFQHYDGRQLTIHGTAGKIRLLPVIEDDLCLELGRYVLARRPSSEEFLLYPEKLGPEFYGGPVGVIWENCTSELSPTAMHRWWTRRLENAGLPHPPTREARHTAVTEFLRDTGNLKLARKCSPATPTSARPRTSMRISTPVTLKRHYAGKTAAESFRSETPYLRGKWRRRESNPRNVPPSEV
jgi:integrase